MDSINAIDYKIIFNKAAYNELNSYLKEVSPSLIIVIVDTNTHQHCLAKFLAEINTDITIEIIEIEAGEEYKTIDTCISVWETLSEIGADRKSLIINLGGGVITDIGGFIACTYRRGIKYVNVPTSLLAMVDASVGGKTGVDLGSLKNQIGVIRSGDLVLVDTSFLGTLPQEQLKSGLSEMLKHGLIKDRGYWNEMRDLSKLNLEDLDNLIHKSIKIKYEVVTEDPLENGIRKTLNYGHTLGHAIESHFLETYPENKLLHGEAIAIGMIMETYISHKLLNFPKNDLEEVTSVFNHIFEHRPILENDQETILELLKFDKKNEHGKINFVLLKDIGNPILNQEVKNDLIYEAFRFYNNLL